MLTYRSKNQSENAGSADPEPENVREELSRVLASSFFKATPRRKKLLEYLVEELLAGRAHELKGYSIATLVFGRDDNFDPQTDPVVRLEARRLRHDLDGYYVSAGRDNPMRISIPKGQYTPVIERLNSSGNVSLTAQTTADGNSDPTGQENKPRIKTTKIVLRTTLATALVCLLALAIAPYAGLFQVQSSSGYNPAANGTTLAVLPFEVEGDAATKAFFAKGMADEIMSAIDRFGVFRLYMPSGSDMGRSPSDPVETGRRLKLDYVVSGITSIDSTTETLRVNARLVGVQSQRILWIGSYDRAYSVDSMRAVQREIASAVASTVGQPYGVMRTDESSRMAAASTLGMTSYECVLRAYAYRRSFKQMEHTAALSCLEQAVKRDPGYAEAWAMLGWLQMDEGRFGWSADGNIDDAYTRALANVRHAIALDRDNVSALKALSSIEHYRGNYSESARIQRQALAINPNDPDTLAQLGWRLAVRGKFEEGIPFLARAIERAVNPPGWYYHLIAVDQYLKGEYGAMLTTARRAAIDDSGISWSFVAIAEGALGQKNEARVALAKMAKASPLLAHDPAEAYRRHQAVDSVVDALVTGLEKAGWERGSHAQPGQ